MNTIVQTAVAVHSVQLDTPTGTLAGTLTGPTDSEADHVVLIIAGSGPTDRDGNSAGLPGKNNSLKMLAEGLAQAGIASLRTDKRGVGESKAAAPPENEVHFEAFVDDAVAWLKQLQSNEQFQHFSIIGHSEGSLIGMLAAQRSSVDAFVSLEGAGRTAQATIMTQLGAQLPPPLLNEVQQIVDQLAAGQLVDSLPASVTAVPALTNMFRASIQPYLISWFRYDPAMALADLMIPILIVQGTADLQVNVEDANRLAFANPQAQLLVLEGMNHVLKDAPMDQAGNLATYSQPDLPLAEGLVTAVTQFLNTAEHITAKGE
jgi:uncharacterized protein